MFAPTYLGKWSNLTSRFFKGVGSTSNHHLVEVRWVLSCYKHNYICTCVVILSNWFSTNDWLVSWWKKMWVVFCWEQFLVKQLNHFQICHMPTVGLTQPTVTTNPWLEPPSFKPLALDSPMTPHLRKDGEVKRGSKIYCSYGARVHVAMVPCHSPRLWGIYDISRDDLKLAVSFFR